MYSADIEQMQLQCVYIQLPIQAETRSLLSQLNVGDSTGNEINVQETVQKVIHERNVSKSELQKAQKMVDDLQRENELFEQDFNGFIGWYQTHCA